jgi:hypothetical protein
MWVNYTESKWNLCPPCTVSEKYIFRCRRRYGSKRYTLLIPPTDLHCHHWYLPPSVLALFVFSPSPCQSNNAFSLKARGTGFVSLLAHKRRNWRLPSVVRVCRAECLGQYLVTSYYIHFCDAASLNDIRARQPSFYQITSRSKSYFFFYFW